MQQGAADLKSDAKGVKRFALTLLGGSLLGAAILFLRGRPQWRWLTAGGMGLSAAAYFWPAAATQMRRAMTAITRALTDVLTGAILTVAYYAFFTPLAVIARRLRHGGIKLRPDQTQSFWVDIPESQEEEKIKYERLY